MVWIHNTSSMMVSSFNTLTELGLNVTNLTTQITLIIQSVFKPGTFGRHVPGF